MKEYSKEAQWVLEELSPKEIKQLHKDNPFRNDRNSKIIELKKRGVKTEIISEITGISGTSIRAICRMERKYQKP